MEIHALAHLAPRCSSPIHKCRGHKRFKCHSLIRHSSEGESKGNFYDAVEKRVEIWLPFDFRSAARLSFRSDFSIPSFSATRVPYLTNTHTYTRSRTHTHTHAFPARRDPTLMESPGGRGEIDHAAVQVPVPNFRLSLLRRPELDGHHRSRRAGLRQHQAEGAEYLVELELRR